MSIEIESEDVIRLILQFLKENQLEHTASVLEDETLVTLNTVESRDTFTKDIAQGRWDTVLKQVSHLKIPPRKLMDLYEQVIIELVEMKEHSAARTLLRQTEPMFLLKQHHPERYLRLEHLLSRSLFDPKDAYASGMTRDKRRQIIAQALGSEVAVAPPSRLMTLLEQCAQWQHQQGILSSDADFDVFQTTATVESKEDADALANEIYCTIKFPGKNAYAECSLFSPNGQYFVTGSVDGFIEVWNHSNGKLRKDLNYQAEDNLMAMDESVISLGFNSTSELLVSGSTDGKIAIWKTQSGFCQRRFSPAHSQGVTSVCFNRQGTEVLSGSYDKTVKIHGVRSGKSLKKFTGHASFVNTVLYVKDDTCVLSGGSDGTIKMWDVAEEACLYTINPAMNSSAALAVQSILSVPLITDQVLVCNKSNRLALMTMDGKVTKTFSHGKEKGADFISAAASPHGELIYAIAEDSAVYCFSVASGSLLGETKISDSELVGISSHPLSNIVACNDDQGHVYCISSK
ncbi:WD40 repeat-containing protein-like protein SMU1 [Radiomyces spectabilis]|uniref:WD40 repeat-containing protein-like protein SMU1 n=1 Tax=Radiomyces spectabilis TaxID=64574 RepID=UPI00221F1FDF|nr:WD40 repeat-containing protein-like protein SMU1 [Radiomyces spectabilis]KAI8377945.1 WD40 repeat-containing protein-like protein SMU1 [Radiomyces spectabilis]